MSPIAARTHLAPLWMWAALSAQSTEQAPGIPSSREMRDDNYLASDFELLGMRIFNPSAEFVRAGEPEGWMKGHWGDNTALFEHLEMGYDGKRSLKITVKNHKGGDAKWFHDAIPVKPGTYYRFTNHYQSDVSTRVTTQVIRQDGSVHFLKLPNARPSRGWRKYTTVFQAPMDATRVSMLHLLAGNGYLITDDYSLKPVVPRKFKRALLSLTFDDGWEANVSSVILPARQYGFKTTQFYATRYIQGSGLESFIRSFVENGHEIGSHSVNHPDLTKCSPEELEKELKDSRDYLESFVGKGLVRHFAAPFGIYNDVVLSRAPHYYASYRTTDEGFNQRDSFDPWNVKVKNVFSTTTDTDVKQWVEQAQASDSWLVLVYHRIGEKPGTYDTLPVVFKSHLEVIKASKIAVLTYGQAFQEVTAQVEEAP